MKAAGNTDRSPGGPRRPPRNAFGRVGICGKVQNGAPVRDSGPPPRLSDRPRRPARGRESAQGGPGSQLSGRHSVLLSGSSCPARVPSSFHITMEKCVSTPLSVSSPVSVHTLSGPLRKNLSLAVSEGCKNTSEVEGDVHATTSCSLSFMMTQVGRTLQKSAVRRL
jgi:hypothetical protein